MQEEKNRNNKSKGEIDWKEVVACAPLVLLAIPSSYGVGRFFNLIDPDIVSWMAGAAFESAYLGAITFRERRSQGKFITVIVMAVAASVTCNIMDAALELRLLREGHFDWVGWMLSAFLGVFLPLVNLAYAFLMHGKNPKEAEMEAETNNPDQQNQIDDLQAQLAKIQQDSEKRDSEYRQTHSQILTTLSDLTTRLSQPQQPVLHLPSQDLASRTFMPTTSMATAAAAQANQQVSLLDLLEDADFAANSFTGTTEQVQPVAVSPVRTEQATLLNTQVTEQVTSLNSSVQHKVSNQQTEQPASVGELLNSTTEHSNQLNTTTEQMAEELLNSTTEQVQPRPSFAAYRPNTVTEQGYFTGGQPNRVPVTPPSPSRAPLTTFSLSNQSAIPTNPTMESGDYLAVVEGATVLAQRPLSELKRTPQPTNDAEITSISSADTITPANVVPFRASRVSVSALNSSVQYSTGVQSSVLNSKEATEQGKVTEQTALLNTTEHLNSQAGVTEHPSTEQATLLNSQVFSNKVRNNNSEQANNVTEQNRTDEVFSTTANTEQGVQCEVFSDQSTEQVATEQGELLYGKWTTEQVAILDDPKLSLRDKSEKLYGKRTSQSWVKKQMRLLQEARQSNCK